VIQQNFIDLCKEKGKDYYNAKWFNGEKPSQKRKAAGDYHHPGEKKGKSKRSRLIEEGKDTALALRNSKIQVLKQSKIRIV